MKKLLLLALVMLGGVVNVSADDYLPGSWNDWARNDASKFTYTDGVGTLTLSLAASTPYTFGLDNDGTWRRNGGVMCFNNCTGWTFGTEGDNCTIYTTSAGYYTFTITWSNSVPSISVTYPGSYDDVVYFCNTPNWDASNAYILHSSYWDSTKGSGCQKQPNGIAMTNIEGTNIWKAEFPTGARSGYIAFTKDNQDGYANFYATKAVYKTDFPISGSYVYVPSATSNESHNSVDYYNNGEWHKYPSYTRSVTSGNWGTLCLPFDATISGANVYTIASKVMGVSGPTAINLNEVEGNTVAAGKPYIFQATGSTLSATYSGSYAAASAGYGMMGNLSSTPVTVAVGEYVVKDNKVRKVVTGGTGVTIGQYRAYIDLDEVDVATSRSAFFLGSDDNETTGIENVQTEKSQNAVYNLNGQRVKDGQKGLLIVNGKKVMNK